MEGFGGGKGGREVVWRGGDLGLRYGLATGGRYEVTSRRRDSGIDLTSVAEGRGVLAQRGVWARV